MFLKISSRKFILVPRGGSFVLKVYEISDKTIGFLKDFYENNRMSCESVRDFEPVIYPPRLVP